MKTIDPKFKSRTSWRAKLERKQEPKIVQTPPKMAVRLGKGRMLVPTPMLVASLVKKVPKGKLATVRLIREKLAEDFKADVTCPLTTGIFLRISAEAAEEDRENGVKNIAPYWRVLKEDGSLNPKFPGGVKQQAEYLEKEGFQVLAVKKGKTLVVRDFEDHLAKFK